MNKKTKRLFAIYCALVLVFAFAVPALADGDPLQVINNLSTFIFSLIRAIGLILLGFGIVQIGFDVNTLLYSERISFVRMHLLHINQANLLWLASSHVVFSFVFFNIRFKMGIEIAEELKFKE